MSSYTNVFGFETLPPSGKTYRLIPLVAHTQLNWPTNYEGTDYLADINDVTGNAANWHLSLPPANTVSVGQDLLIRNIGLYAFQVNNASGVPVATLNPGEVKYLYLSSNSTSAGVWNSFTFGAGSSAADAASLKGSGLTVIGSKLASAHPVYSLDDTVTATPDDRAKIFVYTGGSRTLTLPSSSTLGDNWFIGVRNAGSGSITVLTSGLDRIDHQTSVILSPGESLFAFCTGATYYTVGYGRSTQFQFTKLVKDVSAGGTFTLTSGEAANKLLQFTGTPASNVTVIVPSIVSVYYVHNLFTGSATLTVKTAAGTGETMSSNEKSILFCDSVNVVAATSVSGGGGGGGGGGTFSGVFSDGTQSAPAISFSSDSDLGMWRNGANSMAMSAGNLEVMRWTATAVSIANGNFGVGTVTPQAKVDVRGLGIFSGGNALSGSLPTGTVLQLGGADTTDTRAVLDSYGSSGGAALTFRASRGTASAPTATQADNYLGSISFRGRGTTGWTTDRASILSRATQTWTDTAQGSCIHFYTTSDNSTTPHLSMMIDENGWVSINSNFAPVAPLDVNGIGRFLGAVECAGIAASKPDIPLSLDNSDYHTLMNLQTLGVTRSYVAADATYSLIIYNDTGLIQRFMVRNDATGVDAYGYNTISDERLKENWEEVPYDFINRLSTVKSGYYNLIGEKTRQLGVGAQSLQMRIPEVVNEGPDGTLSVSYGNAALVGVVELAKEVVRLRNIVESLI